MKSFRGPVRRSTDITGWLLDGRFEVLERLGEGGMSTVYRARRVADEAEFAIKVLKRAVSKDLANLQRLELEAEVMMAMDSPYITKVHEFCSGKGKRAFLVMELLHGRILANVIRDGPLTPKLAVAIAGQVTSGLEIAHAHGLIHRDLKPSNIMLCESVRRTRAKLLDFGLVKSKEGWSGITQPGMVVGTAHYCAPEQALGDEIGPFTDIYALGCVLFEMLVGWPLFSGDNAVDVMAKHVSEPPPPLSKICPWPVSPRLAQFMEKCLAKAPEDRFQETRSVRRQLAAVLLDLKKKKELTESTENFQPN